MNEAFNRRALLLEASRIVMVFARWMKKVMDLF